jgi:translocation and assembly module TamB
MVVLLLLVAVGVYVMLRTAAFHNYVLRTTEQSASESLNTRVTLQNFAVHPSTLSLDLYGMTIYGVGPGAGAPLLQADHLGLGVRIISAWRDQWYFDDVTVDHPVANVIMTADGQSNLPTPSGNSNTNVFDLAIRRILLDRGEVYYNDRKTPLEADLNNLTFQSKYDAANGGHYYGTLSYQNGHLQYGTYAPVPHDLRGQFDAQRSGLTLSNLTLKSGQSQLLLNASVDNYANPKLHAKYVVILALAELRKELKDPSLPAGMVMVDGTADYARVAGKAAIDSASVEGDLRSAVLQLRTPSLRADVRDLSAHYSVANGNAEVRDITARLLGGDLHGTATVRDLSGKQQGHVTASLRNVSLAEIKRIANSASLKPVGISGRGNANLDATWTGSFNNLMARADAAASGNIAAARQNSQNATIPINAAVHARYDGANQQIALNHSYLRTPQTSVNLDGTVSKHSALQVQLQANDLHELETVAGLFTPPPAEPLDLHGRASFNGGVRGTTSAPQIAGQLNAANVMVRGTSMRTLRTSVQASPSLVSLQNGALDLGKQGHVTFSVQSGLHQWEHLPSSPFVVNLNASQLSIAELARAADVTTPVSGTLNANIAAHGTQLNPIGQGDINLKNAVISGEPIQTADVRFQGTGDAVHANLLTKISAGTAQGEVTYYPKQQGYDAMLKATNIHLEQLQSLKARNIQVSGALNLTASGRGTVNDPQGTVSLTIPQLTVQNQQIRDVNLQANVVNHEATFNLGSRVIDTPLRAQGKVALTGDYYADASLDTPVIPLQPLLAAYAPAQAANVSGQTEIHATLRGPLKNKEQVQAHLNVPTLAVTYRTTETADAKPATLQIAAVGPIRADYAGGIVSLQPGEIKGTGTDIRYQGRFPVTGNAASTLSVKGTVDLTLAQVFDPTVLSGGQLQFDIDAAGHQSDQNVQGEIRIVNASFATEDVPIGLSNANGVLTLRRDRLDITKFTGTVGGGTVTASGGIAYRPNVQFNIGLRGSGMRLLYPQSVRSELSMSLAMNGSTDYAVLQGQVNIDRVSFTPDFDLSTFIAQFGGVSTPPPTQGFADNLKLNIAVRSSSELNIVSQALSVQGDANLRVIGTASDPVIVGRTNLTGGDIIFLGNRYIVQGGTIAFVNTMETEPIVNLSATTTIQQYNIGMRFRGPIDRLHTSYTSDPALAPADIIHLLAFGNIEEAANAGPSQSTTLGAESLVASQVSGQVTSRLQKALGISQLSVDPQLGASNASQQQGARITVQQRVTSKLFVTFSTDVTTTQNAAVQMQYQINRKWSLSGVRDQNGGFGLDGRYHKDF